MELEPGNAEFQPVIDRRARVPEPLPVRLVAIADVRLPAPAGVELNAFYVKLLGFERMQPLTELTYRADNFELHFEVHERPVMHDSLRALVTEIPSLREAEQKLIDGEYAYTRQRGTAPGTESLVLLDPAGNWLELVERREIV
jgi:hypothetical protein